MYPTKSPIIPNKPAKVFGAGMGNFNNAEIPPNDRPVMNDRIEYFINISSTLILK